MFFPLYFGNKSTVTVHLTVVDVWDNISNTAKVKPSALNDVIQTADEKLLCTVIIIKIYKLFSGFFRG